MYHLYSGVRLGQNDLEFHLFLVQKFVVAELQHLASATEEELKGVKCVF